MMTDSPLPSLKSTLVSVSQDEEAMLTSMSPGWLWIGDDVSFGAFASSTGGWPHAGHASLTADGTTSSRRRSSSDSVCVCISFLDGKVREPGGNVPFFSEMSSNSRSVYNAMKNRT